MSAKPKERRCCPAVHMGMIQAAEHDESSEAGGLGHVPAGVIQATERDEFSYQEMITHLCLQA